MDIEAIREKFKADKFAVAMGVEIASASPTEGARCVLKTGDMHQNAAGNVQGGAIYALADFAFGVAANVCGLTTVTLDSTIRYLRPAKCGVLEATARPRHEGRTVVVYDIEVRDCTGDIVALVTTAGFRREIAPMC